MKSRLIYDEDGILKTRYVILFAVLVFVGIVALSVFICSTSPPNKLYVADKIYIISVNKTVNFETKEIWLLQYAINGRIEQAVFSESGLCEKYIEYLRTVGNVE